MLPNESITSMFTRMITITNSLDGLGRTYTIAKIVRKIIKSQPKTWKAKGFTKLLLRELNGSLMNHKITMEKQEQGEKPKKTLEFKTIHHINDDDDDDVTLKRTLP
ncbi:hypothetical protein NC653_039575 [Populus alba x Populus x berolinensis]|uniref:Uncharacterized protein n=1 Tax=Populus alba x Populus x berolinensis TaxID=444605 RepID=A0AAD6LBJ4_9ROSI|nr:hypothetical protein NC653_039575 [Populus alba x Populus x berolinensis]